jgi:hypothetical protein
MTTITIPHTIRGESYTFGVEIDGDLPEATITYPAIDAGGPDLSTVPSDEAYPVAAIEAAVSAELGRAVRFARCDAHGAEGDAAYEVWRFRAE